LTKNQDFRVSKTVKTLSIQDFWSVEIESLDQDLDKNQDIRVIKTVETLLRQGFWSVKIFSTCQDKVFEVLRSRVSIEIKSRQIKTPRLMIIIYHSKQNLQSLHYRQWKVI
jgi:hypothetical protein